MPEVLLGSSLALGLGVGAWYMRKRRLYQLSRDRLSEPFLEDEEHEEVQEAVGLAPRYGWIGYVAVGVLSLALYTFAAWAGIFCLALLMVGGVAVNIGLGIMAKRRALLLETQLAESIDLIVGGLHAGAASLDAIDTASKEVREPLRTHLQDLVGAIRLGETPHDALDDLRRSVPLESYRLFCFTLAVHQETGGSLAPTLAMVARSIRDNVDLKRRINAETTQAQASVFGILGITYGIGFVTWQTHPARVETFIADDMGIRILAVALILQALGLFWMSRMIKIRY
ncbi:MAG: tight adherence protein B [Candidatus Paceibacteria bacterium]|jgi:tight adherence protein B